MNFKILTNRSLRIERGGFSLIETSVSIVLLGIITSSLILVFERNLKAITDSTNRMKAHWVARENMEEILANQELLEMVEYGSSEKYPGIEWTKIVEPFANEVNGDLWLRVRCLGHYEDTEGEDRSVELQKWLYKFSQKELQQIAKRKNLQLWELKSLISDGEYGLDPESPNPESPKEEPSSPDDPVDNSSNPCNAPPELAPYYDENCNFDFERFVQDMFKNLR